MDSTGVLQSYADVLFPKFLAILKNLKQQKWYYLKNFWKIIFRNQSDSAKIGAAIFEATQLSHEQIIPGVNQIILIVSADGLSRYLPILCLN